MKDIYDIDTSDSDEVKMLVKWLVVECPVGGNPSDCPLNEIRKWPLKDRIAWVNNQGYPEHLEIYLHHKQCLARMENMI